MQNLNASSSTLKPNPKARDNELSNHSDNNYLVILTSVCQMIYRTCIRMFVFILVLICTVSFSFISIYTSSFCTVSLLVQTSSVLQYIGLVQFEGSNSWYYVVQYSFALDPVPVCTVARLDQLPTPTPSRCDHNYVVMTNPLYNN